MCTIKKLLQDIVNLGKFVMEICDGNSKLDKIHLTPCAQTNLKYKGVTFFANCNCFLKSENSATFSARELFSTMIFS